MPLAAFVAALALTWTPQASNTQAGLRGLHVVSSQVIWASGTKGTFLLTPVALPEEGAFAASGTCLVVQGKREAWFATGGPGAARVFHTVDAGQSWAVSTTPLTGTNKSSGIFSLFFSRHGHGLAVGGDYEKPHATARTMATTNDGGKTWTLPNAGHLSGYRSGVTILRNGLAIAVGTSGIDFSTGSNQVWAPLAAPALNAVASSAAGSIWAVGPAGMILKLVP